MPKQKLTYNLDVPPDFQARVRRAAERAGITRQYSGLTLPNVTQWVLRTLLRALEESEREEAE